jgi:hypothetical protein
MVELPLDICGGITLYFETACKLRQSRGVAVSRDDGPGVD